MVWLAIVVVVVVLAFGFVLAFGAPFVPTLKRQTKIALDLLELKPGQLLVELGSGDGRMLRAAAKRGILADGYELNPLLVLYSKIRGLPYRRLARTHWRNFWHVSLAPADGIYVFLLRPYMAKLNKKITHEVTRPTRVVSFAFALPNRKPSKTKAGLMLYEFEPANPKT